jgi:Mg-chelatase subunit ChlD
MRKRTVVVLFWAVAACSSSEPGGQRSANGSSHPNGVGGGAGATMFNDNTNPAAIGGGAAPTNPGGSSDVCEKVHLSATQTTPDMLIVLDRSGSMGLEGRWQPSVSAVRSIVSGLQAQIRFGLALFPDPAAAGSSSRGGVQIDASSCISDPDPLGCVTRLLADAGVAVNTGTTGGPCAPGKIVVPVGLNSASAIDTALSMTTPNGGTPTPDTLRNLVDQFAVTPAPDEPPRSQFILLVTDGQPTCPNGGGSLTTQPDIDASDSALEMLTARGVRTYVIGYNTSGPGNEDVAAVLDGFAQRGGTGDTHHRPVEDEASLASEFQRIAAAAVSCSFALDEAPARADYVLVRVDGKQINLGDPNGWSLVNQRSVELHGSACTQLQSGGTHAVDAEVQCDVVTPE